MKMKISGYVYKFGNRIGSSNVVADKESFVSAVTKLDRIPCLMGYPTNCTNFGGHNVVGYSYCDVTPDGVFASVDVIEGTPYSRILNEMSDDELTGNLQFGFLARGEIKDDLMTDITIPYIVLQCNSFHYPVEYIER